MAVAKKERLRMFGWLKSRRERSSERIWKLPEMKSFHVPEGFVLYLIGFSYDAVTAQTITWIRDILVSRKVRQDKIFRFNDNSQGSKEELTESLKGNATRIEIFCGHGCN